MPNGRFTALAARRLYRLDPCTQRVTTASIPDHAYDLVVTSRGEVLVVANPSWPSPGATSGVWLVDTTPAARHREVVQLVGPSGPLVLDASENLYYAVQSATPVTIAIYDAAGRLVRPFADQVLLGQGAVSWDGKTSARIQAAAGVYFFRLAPNGTPGQEQVRRVTLVR